VQLLASGRDADVYALDADRVLRRYRRDGGVEREARVMRHLHGVGFPVPRVHSAAGPDLVLDRLEGPTMLDAMLDATPASPVLIAELGALHRRLHEVEAPSWLGSGRVLHLDFHPGNVIVTGDGPVVIDWTNATAGDPSLDTATTYALMAVAEVPGFPLDARADLLAAFRASCGADPLAGLAAAVAARAHDANLTAAEHTRMTALLDAR
jgi:aminoglycoside phosphotransferase (APT) family kinase protein